MSCLVHHWIIDKVANSSETQWCDDTCKNCTAITACWIVGEVANSSVCCKPHKQTYQGGVIVARDNVSLSFTGIRNFINNSAVAFGGAILARDNTLLSYSRCMNIAVEIRMKQPMLKDPLYSAHMWVYIFVWRFSCEISMYVVCVSLKPMHVRGERESARYMVYP